MNFLLKLLIYMFVNAQIVCNCCNTFQNVTALIRTKDGNQDDEIRLNGCLDKDTFTNKVRQIIIYSENIKVIENGTFNDLRHLKKLSIIKSGINDIEKGAFRNLRKIEDVVITFNNIAKISNGVFNGLSIEKLYLNNNGIKVIETLAFTNMDKLLKLYLGRNKIGVWDSEWFLNSATLKTIDLQFNNLKTIPRKAFVNIPNIKKIYFDFNNILTVQTKAFKTLAELKYLGLRYNKLIFIDQKAFPKNFKIKSLRIDANRLNYLPMTMMERVEVRDIYINGNPWKCQCMDGIATWIARVNGTTRNDVCKPNQIPLCIDDPESSVCTETYDEHLCESFISKVRGVKDLHEYCVRLDT